jgi:hypothetical protein
VVTNFIEPPLRIDLMSNWYKLFRRHQPESLLLAALILQMETEVQLSGDGRT